MSVTVFGTGAKGWAAREFLGSCPFDGGNKFGIGLVSEVRRKRGTSRVRRLSDRYVPGISGEVGPDEEHGRRRRLGRPKQKRMTVAFLTEKLCPSCT